MATAQLPRTRRQRVTAALFVTAVALQLLFSVTRGGLVALFAPAVALGIAAAFATLRSDEALRTLMPKRAFLWKATFVVAIFASLTFLFPEEGLRYPLIFFSKIILTDTALLCLGNLAAVTFHAVARERNPASW
jgi:hypothetical protein